MNITKITALAGAAAMTVTALGATTAAVSTAPAPARFTGTDSGAAAYQVPAGGAAYATSFQVTYWRYDTPVLASGATALSVSGKYATVTPASLSLPQRSNGAPVTEFATVKIAVPAGAPSGTYTDTVTATEANSQPVKFTFKIKVPNPYSVAAWLAWDVIGSPGTPGAYYYWWVIGYPAFIYQQIQAGESVSDLAYLGTEMVSHATVALTTPPPVPPKLLAQWTSTLNDIITEGQIIAAGGTPDASAVAAESAALINAFEAAGYYH